MSPLSERTGLVLLIVAGGTLLNTLAGSTINLALPALGRELALSIDLSRWVVLAYLLAVTVALLPAGRAADLLGHRRVYLGGFLLFGLASLLCGLASQLSVLLASRVLQGVAGAMVMAAGPALITTSVPASRRGRSLGLLSSATYVGLTLGPPLGGWLLRLLSWRWVFWINVPVALLVVVCGGVFLPAPPSPRRRGFDAAGSLTISLALIGSLVTLTQGADWGWLSLPTLGTAAVGATSFAAFWLVERRHPRPLLDLGLFRSRRFSGAAASALCNYFALFVPTILMPFYLLEGRSLYSSTAGLILAAQPLAMALLASPSGWLSDHIGTRTLAMSGMGLLAVGLAGLSTASGASSLSTVALWLGVMGSGTGLFISPNSSALMGAAPREQQGVAGAVMAVARNLGMMLGVSGGTEIYHRTGGHSGRAWVARDYRSLRLALLCAALAAALGVLTVALGGKEPQPDRELR